MKKVVLILLTGLLTCNGLAHGALIRGDFSAVLYTDAQSQGTGSYQTDYSGASITGYFIVDSNNAVRSSPFTLGSVDYLARLTPLASTGAPEVTFEHDADEVDISHFDGDLFLLSLPGSTLNFSVSEYMGDHRFGPFGTTPAINLSFSLPPALFNNKDLADMVGSSSLELNDLGPFHTLVYNRGGAYGGTYIDSASLTLSIVSSTPHTSVSEPSSLALAGFLLAWSAARRRKFSHLPLGGDTE